MARTLALVVATSSGCAGASRTRGVLPAAALVTSPNSSSYSSSSTSRTRAAATTATSVDPGLLSQTRAFPSTLDPVFQSHLRALWAAIVHGDPALALPFLFPRSAYLQVKAIANPGADYDDRLVAWFELDIGAAHALLGRDADEATLVGVYLPAPAAAWVIPGVEYNRLPYWRVFGSRLNFAEDGSTRSFGIFSFISWRGEWYVVHLGPSTRPASRGIVYQPRP